MTHLQAETRSILTRQPHPEPASTPRRLRGYRLPAEWEHHQATWLSWPHNPETWPDLPPIETAYAKMVAALAASEPVHINVNDDEMEARAREVLRAADVFGPVFFHHFATNDCWCRDHGALVVVRDDGTEPARLALDWDYNAWGGKYAPFDQDNRIAARMAEALELPRVAGGMVLEGGSIDVNGAGLLLTSEQCLLNPNRNPQLDRATIEQRLCDLLGIERVLWLGEGIVGDDTDGHVDDMARFVAADTVIAAVEEDPADANYAPLQDNLARLHAMRDQHGLPLRIIPLPMPPAFSIAGQRMPASYANFYIANHIVLVPCFGAPTDQQAQELLQTCFPRRRVVGIDCRALIWGRGATHCLTQQVPAPPALF